MNREIKFRAWDKEEEDMIYNVLPLSDGTFVCENANRIDYVEKYPSMDTQAPSNFVIMQFTGLKDKNDVEIWENDIVRSLWNKRYFGQEVSDTVGVVKFGKHNCIADDPYCWSEAYGFYIEGFHSQNMCGDHFKVEVIGNIYQNVDLLKSE